MSSAGTERRRWAQLCGVMSVGSALESSASQFDHESVTACCCDTVSLSCTSIQKVSPVKPKPASPRPKRWSKHSATAAKSPQGRGERRNLASPFLYHSTDRFSISTSLIFRHWPQETLNWATQEPCTVPTKECYSDFSYFWIFPIQKHTIKSVYSS